MFLSVRVKILRCLMKASKTYMLACAVGLSSNNLKNQRNSSENPGISPKKQEFVPKKKKFNGKPEKLVENPRKSILVDLQNRRAYLRDL